MISCDQYDGPDRGAGDTLHRAIKAAQEAARKLHLAAARSRDIPPCGGCGRRRAALNRFLPYSGHAAQESP
ncbi:MAG TPA: hypothetical protein PKC43_06235 [Phycisphaerales bacterium]|nr:hypothetical protein [Phycisphaerales bacterium]HMP37030.1 hypothetical protein [Phycisphaerales bacterium]